jgi:AcrR family transcriptional regulator
MLAAMPTAHAPAGGAERADAARNRQKILDAAERIVAEQGAERLSLDEVARCADVGVGTVYRRFGDRAGLVFALLDECEGVLRAGITQGPPPLGPGAPPAERLRAFLHALVDLVIDKRGLLLLAEASSPPARYASAPYAAQREHLTLLIGELDPGADAAYLAEALLAQFTPSLIDHQCRVRGLDAAAIKTGLDELLRRLFRA